MATHFDPQNVSDELRRHVQLRWAAIRDRLATNQSGQRVCLYRTLALAHETR